MKIDFNVIGDRILVRPLDDAEKEQVSTSGIILPPAAEVNQDLPQIGEVLNVGEGGTFPDCPDPSKILKVGMFVYFNKYAGVDYDYKEKFSDVKSLKLKVLRLDAIDGFMKSPKKELNVK